MDKKNEKLFLTLFALGLTDSDGELCYEEQAAASTVCWLSLLKER